MKKSHLAIISLLIIGLVAAYGYRKYTQRDPVFKLPQIGKQAPDFTLPALNGAQVKLSDYKGKLVFLNFWASWCPPCRSEIPSFIKAQNKFKDKSFTFIGLAIENKKDVEAYVKQISINYPIAYGMDEAQKIATRYGNPDGALPYTVLISKDQKILAVYPGILHEDKLMRIIEENL